jgi:hypothetical protein
MSVNKSVDKWVLTLGTVFLLFMFAPFIQMGIHNWRLQVNTDTFAGVTTAANVTTANVTLSQSLLRGHNGIPDEVLSITSSIGETVFTLAYDGLGSNSLQISGLNASAARTLTIRYNGQMGGDTNKYMSFVGPFLTIIVFGFIVWAIIHSHRKNK